MTLEALLFQAERAGDTERAAHLRRQTERMDEYAQAYGRTQRAGEIDPRTGERRA